MEKELYFKIALQKELKKIQSHKRTYSCLLPGCEQTATTTSHVLQQSVILESIIDNTGHFYTVRENDIFKVNVEGSLKFERVSLANLFKFPLFCKSHDNDIFSVIEKAHPVNWGERKNALLQTYRTICMQLRKKEIEIDIIKSIAKNRKEILGTDDYFDLRPAYLSIKDKSFFKSEIEKEIFGNDTMRFNISIQNLERRDICFSSGISIHDPNNPKTQEHDQFGYTKEEPITSTFLNFFPYNNCSVLMVVQHMNYPCAWSNRLISQIDNPILYDKILSDILTYRIEEWAISRELYENIGENKKNEFLIECETHEHFYEFELTTDFNLFDK